MTTTTSIFPASCEGGSRPLLEPFETDGLLFLIPPEAAGVAFTSRAGGSSVGPYSGLNLSAATSDEPDRVRANRQRVARALGISPEWRSLKQVHGAHVVKVDGLDPPGREVEGDVLFAGVPETPVAVMAADCLPVALVGRRASAAAHAGWRGLCAGVLEAAVSTFDREAPAAWIGPSIGPCHYQVDEALINRFRARYPESPEFWSADGSSHFRFDLRAAARWILRRAGATVGDHEPPCTYCDSRFYSYRRDGDTGRHAVVVWR